MLTCPNRLLPPRLNLCLHVINTTGSKSLNIAIITRNDSVTWPFFSRSPIFSHGVITLGFDLGEERSRNKSIVFGQTHANHLVQDTFHLSSRRPLLILITLCTVKYGRYYPPALWRIVGAGRGRDTWYMRYTTITHHHCHYTATMLAFVIMKAFVHAWIANPSKAAVPFEGQATSDKTQITQLVHIASALNKCKFWIEMKCDPLSNTYIHAAGDSTPDYITRALILVSQPHAACNYQTETNHLPGSRRVVCMQSTDFFLDLHLPRLVFLFHRIMSHPLFILLILLYIYYYSCCTALILQVWYATNHLLKI